MNAIRSDGIIATATWASRQVCSLVARSSPSPVPGRTRLVGRQRRGWLLLHAQQLHGLGTIASPSALPLVILLGEQRADEADDRRRGGNDANDDG
jgi:hypothetical protein